MINQNINVALIGNPNVGKTSVFNQLTGLNQQVGNYPGITVDKKELKGVRLEEQNERIAQLKLQKLLAKFL